MIVLLVAAFRIKHSCELVGLKLCIDKYLGPEWTSVYVSNISSESGESEVNVALSIVKQMMTRGNSTIMDIFADTPYTSRPIRDVFSEIDATFLEINGIDGGRSILDNIVTSIRGAAVVEFMKSFDLKMVFGGDDVAGLFVDGLKRLIIRRSFVPMQLALRSGSKEVDLEAQGCLAHEIFSRWNGFDEGSLYEWGLWELGSMAFGSRGSEALQFALAIGQGFGVKPVTIETRFGRTGLGQDSGNYWSVLPMKVEFEGGVNVTIRANAGSGGTRSRNQGLIAHVVGPGLDMTIFGKAAGDSKEVGSRSDDFLEEYERAQRDAGGSVKVPKTNGSMTEAIFEWQGGSGVEYHSESIEKFLRDEFTYALWELWGVGPRVMIFFNRATFGLGTIWTEGVTGAHYEKLGELVGGVPLLRRAELAAAGWLSVTGDQTPRNVVGSMGIDHRLYTESYPEPFFAGSVADVIFSRATGRSGGSELFESYERAGFQAVLPQALNRLMSRVAGFCGNETVRIGEQGLGCCVGSGDERYRITPQMFTGTRPVCHSVVPGAPEGLVGAFNGTVDSLVRSLTGYLLGESVEGGASRAVGFGLVGDVRGGWPKQFGAGFLCKQLESHAEEVKSRFMQLTALWHREPSPVAQSCFVLCLVFVGVVVWSFASDQTVFGGRLRWYAFVLLTVGSFVVGVLLYLLLRQVCRLELVLALVFLVFVVAALSARRWLVVVPDGVYVGHVRFSMSHAAFALGLVVLVFYWRRVLWVPVALRYGSVLFGPIVGVVVVIASQGQLAEGLAITGVVVPLMCVLLQSLVEFARIWLTLACGAGSALTLVGALVGGQPHGQVLAGVGSFTYGFVCGAGLAFCFVGTGCCSREFFSSILPFRFDGDL